MNDRVWGDYRRAAFDRETSLSAFRHVASIGFAGAGNPGWKAECRLLIYKCQKQSSGRGSPTTLSTYSLMLTFL